MQEQKLEGDFRYVNSRLITNSEEVCVAMSFTKKEKKFLHEVFRFLSQFSNRLPSTKETIGKN